MCEYFFDLKKALHCLQGINIILPALLFLRLQKRFIFILLQLLETAIIQTFVTVVKTLMHGYWSLEEHISMTQVMQMML